MNRNDRKESTADIIQKRLNEFREFAGSCIPSKMVLWLVKNGYFTAPASTKFHGSYEGGLFEHSMCVAKRLVDITQNEKLEWSRKESPYIVGLLHDVCKCDQYVLNREGLYVWNKQQRIYGHGEKSVKIVKELIDINYEEELCILYHMGTFNAEKDVKEYTDAIQKYPNVLWTHTADMIASHIDMT